MTGSVWGHYEYQPSFILGFHGCDQQVGEAILARNNHHLRPSEKDYDWLGHGIYFWEGNPHRAHEWVLERQQSGAVSAPFVLGAIIDLKHCLDLFDSAALQHVKDAHETMVQAFEASNQALPKMSEEHLIKQEESLTAQPSIFCMPTVRTKDNRLLILSGHRFWRGHHFMPTLDSAFIPTFRFAC